MYPDALDGTRWALEYITLHGVSHMLSGRRIPEATFLDGRISCDNGVNLGEGTYRLRGEEFTVEVEASTSLGHAGDPLPEHDLFEHLCDARTAVMHAEFLHVGFGGGEDQLVYRWEEVETPA